MQGFEELEIEIEDNTDKIDSLFFSSNTKFLTNNGLKFSYEITEDDSLLVLSLFGNLIETDEFELEYKRFSRGFDNRNNNYSELISNKKVDIMNSFRAKAGVNNYSLDNTSRFYIDDTEYSQVCLKDSLPLSLAISTFFDMSCDETLIYNKKIQVKYIYNIFRLYHKRLGLFFPYNKSTKNYEFKSSLYMDEDRLEQLFIKYFSLFKDIVKSLDKYRVFRGSDYKTIFFKSFTLANLVQVMLSLCDYSTKLVYDSKYELFKITYVNNSEATIAYRNKHIRKVFNGGDDMVRVNLFNPENYLIVSQTINGVTTISLVQPNS